MCKTSKTKKKEDIGSLVNLCSLLRDEVHRVIQGDLNDREKQTIERHLKQVHKILERRKQRHS